MSERMGLVRYSDSIETVSEGEAAAIDGIIATMTKESQTVAERDGQTVRASHAKSTGLVKANFTVLPGLPEPLRQGLFAEARSYPAVARFAQGPGEMLSDSVSTHRGVGLKILGVGGPKLPGHDGETQDFVFATGPAFPQSGAATFLTAIKGLQKGAGQPEIVKQAVSTTARVVNAALNAVGGDSPTFGFFGHTKRNPLADAYFSQAALRHGDYVAKMGLFPVSPELLAIIDETIDTGADPDAFRHAVVSHLRSHGAEFEMRVQLCTDLGCDAGRGCVRPMAGEGQSLRAGGASEHSRPGRLQPGATGLFRRGAFVPAGTLPCRAPPAWLADASAVADLPGTVRLPARDEPDDAGRSDRDRAGAGLTLDGSPTRNPTLREAAAGTFAGIGTALPLTRSSGEIR